jgi:hypothetical protein
MKNISSQLFGKTKLMFLSIVTMLTHVSNAADSCQFITALNTGVPTISSYQYLGQNTVPQFISKLKTVETPQLITISENKKFVIVTDGHTGAANVYRVGPSCELTDTGNQLSGSIAYNPLSVLQFNHMVYVLRQGSRIEVYDFNPDTGKIFPAPVATKNLDYQPTDMVYNSTNQNLYIARRGGFTLLSSKPIPRTDVPGAHTLATIGNIDRSYTPGKLQTFDNLLFATKARAENPGKDQSYFIAAYELVTNEDKEQGLKIHQMFRFQDKDETPYAFSVSYYPFPVGYLPPGYQPEYILAATTGDKVYTYELYNNGQIMDNSKVGILNLRYFTQIIASTWSANLDKLYTPNMGFFRLALLENYSGNLQTTIMMKDQDASRQLDLIHTFATPNIISPLNMVISPAPSY